MMGSSGSVNGTGLVKGNFKLTEDEMHITWLYLCKSYTRNLGKSVAIHDEKREQSTEACGF